ncbi:MAG: SpoIID/LytB domain-containing protein [Synechococcaceae bacterium WB9_4xB_025]|jgi:stage II sporulation protein D|nr:SpoIID/LytB domain-containing protein [Synechococcaceae bacterium WB9_4xB_025]
MPRHGHRVALFILLISSASIGWRLVHQLAPPADLGAEKNQEPLLDALLQGESPSQARANQATVPKAAKAVERGYPVPRVPPASSSLNPALRVALLSQYPVQSVVIAQGASCLTTSGQLLSSTVLQSMLRGDSHRQPWVCQSDPGGSIQVNGKAYTGRITLHRQGAGWLAVNMLDLERYVASVVGAEMPSHWRKEALKAQAVAARSYALVHLVRPASSIYNLGDTTRWQAFSGLSSESEATRSATDATRGMVLSYRGGLVESLYAATSEISAEAHGHLGASMSQHGAQELAQQGLAFNEILGRFYQGASIARLKADG